MTEEIKKLIDLRINAGVIDNRSNYALFNEGMRKGSEIAKEIILSKWQEANRWRKVSDELPEVRDESYQILIRIPNIKSSATVWNIRNQSDCDIIAKMGNSEWKPIS